MEENKEITRLRSYLSDHFRDEAELIYNSIVGEWKLENEELERIKTELLEEASNYQIEVKSLEDKVKEIPMYKKEIKNLRAKNQQLRERIDNFLLWVF